MKQAAVTVQSGRRQREAARRRDDVLDVAAVFFAERGYGGAQISEVAQVAEVSLATLYAMFKSKDELFHAVLIRAAESIREVVRSRVDDIEDPAERLLALIDCLLHCFDENRALMQIYTLGTHGLPWSIRQAMGEPMVDIYRAFLDYVTGLTRAAAQAGRLGSLAPEAVALALVGTINATAAEWIESNRDAVLSEAAPTVRAIFEQLLTEADSS